MVQFDVSESDKAQPEGQNILDINSEQPTLTTTHAPTIFNRKDENQEEHVESVTTLPPSIKHSVISNKNKPKKNNNAKRSLPESKELETSPTPLRKLLEWVSELQIQGADNEVIETTKAPIGMAPLHSPIEIRSVESVTKNIISITTSISSGENELEWKSFVEIIKLFSLHKKFENKPLYDPDIISWLKTSLYKHKYVDPFAEQRRMLETWRVKFVCFYVDTNCGFS